MLVGHSQTALAAKLRYVLLFERWETSGHSGGVRRPPSRDGVITKRSAIQP